MTDIGLELVVAFVFLSPWLLEKLSVPNAVRIATAILSLIFLGLFWSGYLHVWVPKSIGHPLAIVLILGVMVGALRLLFTSIKRHHAETGRS